MSAVCGTAASELARPGRVAEDQFVRNGHPGVANSPSSIAVACRVSTLPGLLARHVPAPIEKATRRPPCVCEVYGATLRGVLLLPPSADYAQSEEDEEEG